MKINNVISPCERRLRSFNGVVDICKEIIDLSLPEYLCVTKVSLQNALNEAIGYYCLYKGLNRKYFLEKAPVTDILQCLDEFIYGFQRRLLESTANSDNVKKTCKKVSN